eukprot:15430570-Alexandrium_andersonii.AAC.1
MGAAQHRRDGNHRQQPHLHASGIHPGAKGIHAANTRGIGALATAGHAPGYRGTTAASDGILEIAHQVRVGGNGARRQGQR